jgi:hypothetical protein
MKNFWKNPEYAGLRTLVVVVGIVGAGSFVYANFVNPLGGRGSVIGYGYGYEPAKVVTLPATSITATSVVLNGNVISTGGGPVHRGFVIGTTIAYGTLAWSDVWFSGGVGPFSSVGVTGLACNTTYHYSAGFTNTYAISAMGGDQSFTTLPCVVTYLPQTNAYIAAEIAGGATFTTPQKDAIDRWFRDMLGYPNPAYPTSNVFSKIKVAYLSLTGIYGADRVNAITPGTFNYTDVGSPTYSTTAKNVRYNGVNQYSNTTFTPNGSTSFTSSNFTGFGIHRVDTAGSVTTNGQVGEVGGGNSYMNLATSYKTIVNGAKTAYSQSDTRPINGLWFTSWSASNILNTYYNGTKIKTITTAFNNTPTRSLIGGAINAAVPVYSSASSTFDFHLEVLGAWTDAEAKLIYDATKALKLAFGVTWL